MKQIFTDLIYLEHFNHIKPIFTNHMSADFLFPFLMIFQVQFEPIRQSGIYQMMEEGYPQIWKSIDEINSDNELGKILKFTGLSFDQIDSLNLYLEGAKGISKVRSLGQEPRIGEEIIPLMSAKFNGVIEQKKLITFLLDELAKEKGNESRDLIEQTLKEEANTTYLTIPKEVIGKKASSSDLLFTIMQSKSNAELMLGIPEKVKLALAGKSIHGPLASLNEMQENHQVSFIIKVDPSLWSRPEFEANPQNPLFAGLANSVKGIREVGFSLCFLEESIDFEVCVNCEGAESALGLWTLAQGGLGMAQLAMAQEGSQIPAILNRIETKAVANNVFIRTDVLPSDIKAIGSQLIPSDNSDKRSPKVGPEILQGKKAPFFRLPLLDGGEFNLPDQIGKVIILDFWASWCIPCTEGLPKLHSIASAFEANKVQFLAINQGESKKTINKFMSSFNVAGLDVAMDSSGKVGDLFLVEGIPQTVVIDPKGMIRHVHVGYGPDSPSQLRKEITGLLLE